MRKLFTILSILAILLAFVGLCAVVSYSQFKRTTTRFKTVDSDKLVVVDSFVPGQTAVLKPGKQVCVVLSVGSNSVEVVVASGDGGVKTQFVSPMVLDRYGR